MTEREVWELIDGKNGIIGCGPKIGEDSKVRVVKEADLDRAVDRLRRYGRHLSDCGLNTGAGTGTRCTCGFGAALRFALPDPERERSNPFDRADLGRAVRRLNRIAAIARENYEDSGEMARAVDRIADIAALPDPERER